jgi:subtilisin family serine protease
MPYLRLTFLIPFALALAQILGQAQTYTTSLTAPPPPPYRSDRIVIKPLPGIASSALVNLHSAHNISVLRNFEGMGGMQILGFSDGQSVPALVAAYQQSGLVEFAEPDYTFQLSATPNDPKFLDGTLWNLNNFGQSGGTVDADIDAPEGWDVLNSASNIIVAVLDTGVRYTHEDLAANMWVDPISGLHGFNALVPGTEPADDEGHGTLDSGILGAVGNNGKGVVGVAWKVQIMAAKCFNSNRTGNETDIITCIDFARTNGARIINGSFDGGSFSAGISNAIVAARDAGIICVFSAGNNAANVDAVPRYPACNNIDNIVSLAYTTRNDALGSFSNFGATNVDLAAPGKDILSTFFASDNSYLGNPAIEGTSFAAPAAAGALALLLAKYPTEDYHLIIQRLLNGVDPLPALAGKCVTGGRLNLRKALSPPINLTLNPPSGGQFTLHVSCGPNRTCVIQTSPDLTAWNPVFTNTTTTNFTFDFPDPGSTNASPRYYRVVSTL